MNHSKDIMAAVYGMLKLASSSSCPPETQQLIVQIPSIYVSPPTEPQALAGAQAGDSNANGKRRNLVSDDLPPTKRVAPTPTNMLTVSKDHFRTKYIDLKPLSEGDNGETHAAILKSDLIDIVAAHGDDRSQAFFDAVRDKLVAVKFAKPNNVEGDLSNEIDFFTKKFPHQHKSINARIDSHLDGKCQWLVLPYASGGALLGFQRKHPGDINLSFRWHLAAQIVEALLFLFFGVEDANNLLQKAPQATMVYHGDIFVGNTLLGPPRPDDPTGFPSVIVSDFGRANDMNGHISKPLRSLRLQKSRMRRLQVADINQLGNVLHGLCQRYLQAKSPCVLSQGSENKEADDDDDFEDDEDDPKDGKDDCEDDSVNGEDDSEEEACPGCVAVMAAMDDPEDPEALFVEWMEKLTNFGYYKEDFSDAYGFLCEFLRVAKQQKAATFEPMSAEAIARLNTPFVSNENLRRALEILDRRMLKPQSKLSML